MTSNIHRVLRITACAVAIAILPHVANAVLVTYEYSGPKFTDFQGVFTADDSITGTMTIDVPTGGGTVSGSAVSEISFSATAGGAPALAFTGLQFGVAPSSDWLFDFDPAGGLVAWSLAFVREDLSVIATESVDNIGIGGGSLAILTPSSSDGRTALSSPGTWSVAAIPEPSSLLFFGLTSIGLGAGRLRRRQASNGVSPSARR